MLEKITYASEKLNANLQSIKRAHVLSLRGLGNNLALLLLLRHITEQLETTPTDQHLHIT